MKETVLILAACSLGAFLISVIVTNILVRRKPKGLLSYLKGDLQGYKSYNAVMTAGVEEKYCAAVVAFKPWELAVMNCEIKGNDFSVGKPKIFSEEDLSLIRTGKMRTSIKLYDRQGSLVCSLEVKKGSTKEICGDFPVDIDLTKETDEFLDFIDKLQKRLEDRANAF